MYSRPEVYSEYNLGKYQIYFLNKLEVETLRQDYTNRFIYRYRCTGNLMKLYYLKTTYFNIINKCVEMFIYINKLYLYKYYLIILMK